MLNNTLSDRRTQFLYFLFLVVCCFALRVGWLIPDGAGYCSYLSSLYLDGDLNFVNQYVGSRIIDQNFIHGATITANGYPFTFWGIGTAILWTPFWLIGHALTHLTTLGGQVWTPNGFTIYYNLAVRFSTALMGVCGLILTIHVARRYVDVSPAVIGILVTAIGTPFYWYLFYFADVSHVPASFVIALFLTVFESYRRSERAPIIGFLLGLLGGLGTIVKPNNVLIFVFPLALWVSEIVGKKRANIVREISCVFLGAAFAILLQLMIWQILFGNPLGPILEKGVRHYYKFFTGHFWLPDVLFSSYHGLFFFAPVLLFSFWGLVRMVKTDGVIAVSALAILTFQIVLMANERFFWEGAAFGLRRVVDWTPLFALGVAFAWGRSLHRWSKVLAVIATSWSVLLIFTYSGRPYSVLVDYQSPKVIATWMGEMILSLPLRVQQIFSFPAPFWIFIPAFLLFASVGYFVFSRIILLTDDCLKMEQDRSPSKRMHYMTVTIVVLLLLNYGLVTRAAINGESSKQQYARELKWIADRQEKIMAAEETQFLIHEGKYLALSRSWDSGKASFLEALNLSPDRNQTGAQIRSFVNQHLAAESASLYLGSLGISQ